MISTALLIGVLVGTAFCAAPNQDYVGFKVLRIIPVNDAQIKYLYDLQAYPSGMELDFWADVSSVGNPVMINVGPNDRPRLESELKSHNIHFNIFMDDVQKEIDEENETGGNHAYGFSGFDYGKYHTYPEIQAELRNIQQSNPTITTLLNMGQSYERQRIDAIKISLDKTARKKIVFIDCGIHAREWISPATCMYFLNKVVTSYKYDTNIKKALTSYDIIVLPVFNVDGYAYTYNPRGKRLWRKTRSRHRSCVGADPNRNWDYKWGGAGTSSSPCSDIYHGKSAFSEIEVSQVANYLYNIRYQLKSYYNIHAYSQMWLTPWSYTSTLPRDYQEIERVALAGIKALSSVYGTRYTHGPPPKLLYAVSGGSIDWTYGFLGVKYSYALELRDKGRHGFLLPASEILPTGRETTAGLIAAINAMY